MPLLRMAGDEIFRAPYTGRIDAGSNLDLDPDTRTKSPDDEGSGRGGRQAVELVKVRTRGETKPAAGGRVMHVYPRPGAARRKNRALPA